MKKVFAVIVLVVLFIMLSPTAAAAAPALDNPNPSHVAFCATAEGGQHVADCAQTHEGPGVSH